MNKFKEKFWFFQCKASVRIRSTVFKKVKICVDWDWDTCSSKVILVNFPLYLKNMFNFLKKLHTNRHQNKRAKIVESENRHWPDVKTRHSYVSVQPMKADISPIFCSKPVRDYFRKKTYNCFTILTMKNYAHQDGKPVKNLSTDLNSMTKWHAYFLLLLEKS